MATELDTTGGDVNLKEGPSTEAATDCIRVDGDVRKPVPVPATSGAPYVSSSDSDSITTAQRDAVFNKRVAFPLNLTCMLESVESKGYSHVIHWSQSGNSFVICDADLLLSDVLPKFFKTNENTKIRSFYRKLNRWGFSMSRKSAYSPSNIWRHPEFNRSTAVRYLNQALETGQVIDFLHDGSTLRDQKRKSENSVDCEKRSEDLLYPVQTMTVDCPSILHSRTQAGPTPTLETHPLNMFPRKSSLSKKSGKLSQTQSYSSITHHQQNNRLRGSRSTETFYQGSANASFELIPSSRSNAQFDLTTPLHQERPFSSCAPSATVFNLNAQQIFATHGAALSNSLPAPASPQSCPAPTLATYPLNMFPRKSSLSKKNRKLSQTQSYSSITHHQQKNGLRGSQSTETFYQGSANASFELMPASRSNAHFDLTTPVHQEHSLSSCAPGATMFNLNAQERFATHGAALSNSLPISASSQNCNSTPTLTAQEMTTAHTTTSSSNIPTPITSQESASSLFIASVPKLAVTNFVSNVKAAYATASSSNLPAPFASHDNDNTPWSFAASMSRSPFTNITLNAQEMMAARATTSSSKLPTPITSQNNASPSFAASMPRPPITNFTLNAQKMMAAHATKRSSNLPTPITGPLFAATVPTPPITNSALSARDMMAVRSTKSSSDLLTPITSQVDVSSSFAAGLPIPKLGQPLQSPSAMTEEEESELMDFLGTFSETLLPSVEGEEEGGSLEVEPMPDIYHLNYK